ncbi:MAG TPA: hypothetical protein ENK32_07485, partial [Anaerolineae bacterium]|nr:hypothetical protein [Anaerolineae bacterium]
MVNKFWRLLLTLAALGLGGCVSSAPPLPTQAPTAVLPTPISPTANAVLSAADPPASPTPILSPTVVAPAAPTTAVTQAPPVVLATAAALPSPPPDAPPAPSATAAPDVPAEDRAAVIGFSAGGRPLTD